MRVITLTLLMVLFNIGASARNDKKDLGYLKRIPAPERLIRDVDGATDLERTAKRCAVLFYGRIMIYTLSRFETEQQQAAEERMVQTYTKAMANEYKAWEKRHPQEGSKGVGALSDEMMRAPGFRDELQALVNRASPGLWKEFVDEEELRDRIQAEKVAQFQAGEAAEKARADRQNDKAIFSHTMTLIVTVPLILLFLFLLIRWIRAENRAVVILPGEPTTMRARGVTYTPFTYGGPVLDPTTIEGSVTTLHANLNGNQRYVTSSTTSYRTERFFLLLPDGLHKSMEFTNSNVHVAPGQFFAGMDLKGSDGSIWSLFYYNFHTRQETLMGSTLSALAHLRSRVLIYLFSLLILVPIALAAGVSTLLRSMGLAWDMPSGLGFGTVVLLLLVTYIIFKASAKNAEARRRQRIIDAFIAPMRESFRKPVQGGAVVQQ